METLTPGEKVKKLRLDLGLKQEDITNEKVSKSLISMIEKNKRSLTKSVAIVISNSLNKYYTAMGIEITPDYLLETELDRMYKEIDVQIKELNSLVDEDKVNERLFNLTFEKLMSLVSQWNMKKEMMELTYIKGIFYYKTYQYNSALKELAHVLEYCIENRDYDKVVQIYNLMGMCYYIQMMMEQALTYYLKAYDITIQHDILNKNKMKMKVFFNLILCYRKFHKFDMAIQYINMYRELKWDNPLYHIYSEQVTIMEANIYRDLKHWDKAEKIYKKLLLKDNETDKTTLFLIYDNYANLLREKGNVDQALKYIDDALKLKDNIELKYYLPELYLQQAKCYMAKEEYNKVLTILEKSFDLAGNASKQDSIIELHFAYIEINIKLKDYTTALKHVHHVEKIILENDIQLKLNDLYSFYIELYFILGKRDECLEYITKIRKYSLLKNICERS